MKRPCGNCPFKKDTLKGWLGRSRASEIAAGLIHHDASFACHKTTETDDEGEMIETRDSQHCAGALIMLEKIEKPHQVMRISERLGLYNRFELDMDANVFDTPRQFINHHSN